MAPVASFHSRGIMHVETVRIDGVAACAADAARYGITRRYVTAIAEFKLLVCASLI